jgi:hypothetical protein
MNLWVDDAKPAPEGWAVARTYDDAYRLLRDYSYAEVAFDHDLGDTHVPERTGYTLLCAIERGELRRPQRATIISWNPVGVRRMRVLLDRLGL